MHNINRIPVNRAGLSSRGFIRCLLPYEHTSGQNSTFIKHRRCPVWSISRRSCRLRTVLKHSCWQGHDTEKLASKDKEADHQQSTAAPLSLEWLLGSIEDDRSSRRTVYGDSSKWHRHRDPSRFIQSIIGIPWEPTTRAIFWPVVYLTSLSIAVDIYRISDESGCLPDIFPSLASGGFVLPTATSFALALLLAFRVNTTYTRWQEARIAWGCVLNRTRDLARLALTYMDDPVYTAQFIRWIISFAYSLKEHLTEKVEDTKELDELLTASELKYLAESDHRPNFTLQVASEILFASDVEFAAALSINQNLAYLADVTGACERIIRQPAPIEYTSIEDISTQLEEPFSVLPLSTICSRVKQSITSLQGEHAAAKTVVKGFNQPTRKHQKQHGKGNSLLPFTKDRVRALDAMNASRFSKNGHGAYVRRTPLYRPTILQQDPPVLKYDAGRCAKREEDEDMH